MTVTITVDDLLLIVKSNDTAQATIAFDMGVALIDDALVGAYRECPVAVHDSLVLEVAKTWFERTQTMSGNSQFADFSTGRPVMAPRDPLMTVWPILHRYVSPF